MLKIKHIGLSFSLAIAACGGGGGGGGESVSNVPQTPDSGLGVINNKLESPIVTGSVPRAGRFLFEWNFVPNASYYRLMKSVDGKQSYQQVGDNLLTNSITEDISTFEHDWANANYIVQACDAQGCSLSSKLYTGSAMLSAIAYVKGGREKLGDYADFGPVRFEDITADSFKITFLENPYPLRNEDPNFEFQNTRYSSLFLRSSGGDWTYQPEPAVRQDVQYEIMKNIGEVGRLVRSDTRAICQGNDCPVIKVVNSKGLKAIVSDFSADPVQYKTLVMRDGHICQVEIVSPVKHLDQWLDKNLFPGLYSDERISQADCFSFAQKYNNPTTTKLASYEDPFYSGRRCFEENIPQGTTPMLFTDVKPFADIRHIHSKLSRSNRRTCTRPDGVYVKDYATENMVYTSRDGEVALYERINNEWTKVFEIKELDSSPFLTKMVGLESLLLSNNTVLMKNSENQWKSVKVPLGDDQVIEFYKNIIVSKNHDGSLNIYRLKPDQSMFVKEMEGLKSSNFEMSDGFGSSLSFSKDGLTLAVGAPFEDGAAVGINGNTVDNDERDSGAVYVFRYNNGIWKQIAYVKATNTGTNDNFGSAVGFSPDGKRLFVLAPNEASLAVQPAGLGANPQDNSAPKTGAVYVY